ncbi:hypothetical protein [Cytobacillus gottheilii]|uniref:hypothetical protein n=1 Tax=Cytobacillus gottheilii TaxID=859144 RepID=UPI0009B9D38E|nr:hypothetical protein [Cytobacillus gottheilii]
MVFKNKDRVYMNGKGYGTFISYGINSNDEAIVKFDSQNSEENEFGYNVIPSILLKHEENAYIQLKLSKITDGITGEVINIKNMTGRWFSFQNKDLKLGKSLIFKIVDETFGYCKVGTILSIESKVIRKRDYIFVTTEDRVYQLLKRQ